MPTLKRILCATDLSEAADEAIRQADEWARLHDAELAVLHAAPAPAGLPMTADGVQREIVAWEQRAPGLAARVQERVQSLTGRPDGAFQVAVERGPAAPAIVRHAEDSDADLIVTAAFGESGLWRVLL